MRGVFIVILSVAALLAATANGKQSECLDYHPKIVTLTGRISEHSFHSDPGNPDDRLETYLFLELPHPICVRANGRDENDDAYEAAEKNLKRLQLIVPYYPKGRIGQQMTLTGTLEHAQLGNQHTKVLLYIEAFPDAER
ncbi:hypothetical protein [Azospirillum sp. B4]|uniref:hypothetical protein n=1 Tax=Azospirillum sp. B4 TaxID=95605 RepID=UPI0011DDAC96|nr:hypothetical protein [Azospirillum sp. B4]